MSSINDILDERAEYTNNLIASWPREDEDDHAPTLYTDWSPDGRLFLSPELADEFFNDAR